MSKRLSGHPSFKACDHCCIYQISLPCSFVSDELQAKLLELLCALGLGSSKAQAVQLRTMLDILRSVTATHRKFPCVAGRYFPREGAAQLERQGTASLGLGTENPLKSYLYNAKPLKHLV